MAEKPQERSMEARVGRDNQRYGPDGERLVAGVVPLSTDCKQVLLIQSTRRKGWVLPKGGWERDETQEEAASREAWEEAGIVSKIVSDLGIIPEMRTPEQLKKYGADAPKASYRFFEVRVEEEKKEWPEMHKRDRRWTGYKDAKALLKDRPELLEALERSKIVKTG